MTSQRDLYRRAVEKWGADSQFRMCIEECAELIQALTKLCRKDCTANVHWVAEEIVDVEIMIAQIKQIMIENYSSGFVKYDLKNIKKRKLERLEALVKNGA